MIGSETNISWLQKVNRIERFFARLWPTGKSVRWWQLALLPVTASLALAWMCVNMAATLVFVLFICIISLPDLIAGTRKVREEEAQLVAAVTRTNRLIGWPDLLAKLRESDGTLILEGGGEIQGLPRRVWWTPEPVEELAPMPVPPSDRLDHFGYDPPHPFVIWCHSRYLHPERGSALLAAPQRQIEKKLGMDHPEAVERLKKRYPRTRVLCTVRCRHLCTCGYDLRASHGRCPECGEPIPAESSATGTDGRDSCTDGPGGTRW